MAILHIQLILFISRFLRHSSFVLFNRKTDTYLLFVFSFFRFLFLNFHVALQGSDLRRCMFFRSLKILFVKIQIQICSDYVILVLINHLCFMWTVRHTLNIMVNLSFYESVNPCLNRSKILWLIFVIIVHGSTDLRRIKLK